MLPALLSILTVLVLALVVGMLRGKRVRKREPLLRDEPRDISNVVYAPRQFRRPRK